MGLIILLHAGTVDKLLSEDPEIEPMIYEDAVVLIKQPPAKVAGCGCDQNKNQSKHFSIKKS